jgi:hypothetical protein
MTLPKASPVVGSAEGSVGGRSPFSVPTGLAPEGDPRPAEKVAAELLTEAALPPHARRTRSSDSAVQGPPQAPATPNLVDKGAVFTVPEDAQATIAFLSVHPAPGTTCDETGSTGSLNAMIEFFGEGLVSPPAGIQSAELLDQVVPNGPGSSLVRVDAQVVYDPERTPAETVGPLETVAVITRLGAGPPRSNGRATLTITDPGTVGRLVAKVNTLPTQPPGVSGCPAISTTYQLSFGRSPTALADIIFNAGGCGGVAVTVHGIAQPPLTDAGLTLTLAAFFTS